MEKAFHLLSVEEIFWMVLRIRREQNQAAGAKCSQNTNDKNYHFN